MASLGLLRLYNSALHKHPIATQAVTTGALWGLGDALAQRIESRQQHGGMRQLRRRYNTRRALLSVAFGAAAVGPLGSIFYNQLDQLAASLFPPGSARFIAFKVVADAAIYEPVYILGCFTIMTLGSGGSWRDVQAKVRADFWPTLAAELAVWPAIQAVNFKLVPSPDHQLLVVNLITILDSAFMSLCCGSEDWLQSNFRRALAYLTHSQLRHSEGAPPAVPLVTT